jgi:hypothetical protein
MQEKGWKLLNMQVGGGLGGDRTIWNEQKIIKTSLSNTGIGALWPMPTSSLKRLRRPKRFRFRIASQKK